MVRHVTSKSTDADWGRLMQAAQAGDAAAYRALLLAVLPWLRRYYARRLPPMVTEDAVQDVLLAVHEKRHTFDPSRPFAPWLAAIARYKWIDRLEALKTQASEPLTETIGIPGHEESVVAGSTLNQLLTRVKPAQAAAIRLVKIEGYSIEEASRATGQSAALVKINIHRGIRHIVSLIRSTADAN